MKTVFGIQPTRAAALSLMLLLSLGLLSACVLSPTAPTESMAEAREAIQRAEQTDGHQYARGELDEARAKLSSAEKAVQNDEMVEAKRLAREAKVMAQLAKAKTEDKKANEINQEMKRAAEALTEEMDRKGGQQ